MHTTTGNAMYDRRAFMSYFAGVGLSTTLLPGVLWARLQQQEDKITKAMLKDAEALTGLEFTDSEREAIVKGVNQNARNYAQLRTVDLPNSVPPAIQFDPVLPSMTLPTIIKPRRFSKPVVRRPKMIEDIAFWPVLSLAELVRTRAVSPVELTELYLARLKKHGPTLEAVVTLTEDRALGQARAAEAEIRQVAIADCCTAFRGAQKICSPRKTFGPPGARSHSRISCSVKMRPS